MTDQKDKDSSDILTNENHEVKRWDYLLRHLVSEILSGGYVFWSLFCGLGPSIWFYPLNELDITGYEVYFAILLIPCICGIPFVFWKLQTRWGLAVLRILSCACLGTWAFPSTLVRLSVITVGTGASLLLLVATLWSKSPFQRFITFWGLLLGYFLMLSSRIWYRSLFPTWADSYSNYWVRSVAFICAFDHIFSGYDKEAVNKESSVKYNTRSWIVNGIAFGSLLYVTVSIFGEVSVVSRWIVTGHSETGPDPNPWGAVILICLAFGVFLATGQYQDTFPSSILWWVFGTYSFFGLYRLNHFLGFMAGSMLAIYIMSLWPKMIDKITVCPPARTFTLAMLMFMVEMLFSIWTIAYNFVPGGEYTREHTGYLLALISVTLILPFIKDRNNSDSHTAFVKNIPVTKKKTTVLSILFLLLLGGLSGMAHRYFTSVNFTQKIPEQKTDRFIALIWTFHFGFDNVGLPSFERAASLLKDTDADFITLLESDASKPYLGNNDIASWLGERLNMYSDFGPSTRDHTWGNLILSKYPIVASKHHLLPSPYGELAPAISATVNISGRLVDFVTTHMGNDRDNLDRKLQAEYLSKLLDISENPVVFLGYVTSQPGSRDYKQLIQKGRMKDIDPTDMDRWCQYIMYRGFIRLGYGRISRGDLSDTELQMAKFEIPASPNYVDNKQIERDTDTVPQEQRFNKKFLKSSNKYLIEDFTFLSRGEPNTFHSNTPKYFLP